MATGDFDVRVETTSDAQVVRVTGDLDLATAELVEKAVATVPEGLLVFDLTACTFLDSAGVRVLASTARIVADDDREVRVVATDPGILRVLEITGMNTIVEVHSSVDDAL